VGKQTEDELGEADEKGDDKLIRRTRNIILGMVLLAIFLPLDLATIMILSIGGFYVLMGPISRLLGQER